MKYVRANALNTWNGLDVGFGRVFSGTVTAEDASPGKAIDPGLVTGFSLEIWGVPTSRPTPDPSNQDFVYLRFQRGIMHYDKVTGQTQGLLLADYLKSIMTGVGLPPDLDAQARGSRFYRQYDRSKPAWVARPTALKDTDLTNAFEPGR